MSRAVWPPRIQWIRRQAGAVLRLYAALWLVFFIVYTPFHLYLEPHSDEAESGTAAAQAWATAMVGDEGHDGDGRHERHSAAQHKLKVVNPERLVVAQLFVVPEAEWVDAEKDCPQAQAFGFSGLSPPELPRCWQFLFRAALPVRAPSLLS